MYVCHDTIHCVTRLLYKNKEMHIYEISHAIYKIFLTIMKKTQIHLSLKADKYLYHSMKINLIT